MTHLTKRMLRDLEGSYTIRVMDMPEGSKGCVLFDADDHANIYINARLSRAGQLEAAAHELAHILNDDFHNTDDIRTVESRASQKPSPLGKVAAASPLTDEVPAAAVAPLGKVAAPPALTDEVPAAAVTPLGKVDWPQAKTDEVHPTFHVPSSSPALPHLLRARDLKSLPLEGKVPSKGRMRCRLPLQGKVARVSGSDEVVPRPPASLTSRQRSVLLRAISDLDACFMQTHDV